MPVGPIRTTGSPGASSAQSRELPPISSTISESRPFSLVDPRAGEREPSIESRVPVDDSARSVSKFCRR